MVYNAVVLSSLLYGCETWTLYRRHLRSLETFHMSSLRKILAVTWKDKVSDTEVLRRTRSVSVENIIYRSHLRWIGHLIRMDDGRLPKQLFYGELVEGTRSVGRQLKRYRDQSLSILKACRIDQKNIEALAKDRDRWRDTCRKGLQLRDNERLKWLEDRRRKRKEKTTSTVVGTPKHICTVCGQWLWLSIANRPNQPHTRAQGQDQQQKQQQVVVIIAPDGLP